MENKDNSKKDISFSKQVKEELKKQQDHFPKGIEKERRKILRDVFIKSGSIMDPNKAYHLEFVCREEQSAKDLKDLMEHFSVRPKVTERKGQYVVYIKDGDEICTILSAMGAGKSLMDFENVRIIREVRGDINRRVNAETANLEKTVAAGVKQAEDIEYIIDKKGIEYLPESLREIAFLRREYPTVPLSELAKMTDPPLGKSGVHHRLKKIRDIAEKIREENS